jgi:hypothetical protein
LRRVDFGRVAHHNQPTVVAPATWRLDAQSGGTMHIKLAAALIAVLALSAIACSSAFAEYEGGEWALSGTILEETIAIKGKSASVKLEDTKEGAVECKTSGEGKVGAEGKGEITAMTYSECKTIKSCEAGTITVKAVHLPWKVQLAFPEETTDRANISSGGSGAPGLDLECKVFGIKVNDECTGETSVNAETVTGGVNTIFDSKSAHLTCSLGGVGTGVVTGTILDENPTGHELQVPFIRMEVSNNSGGGEAGGAGTRTCTYTVVNQLCTAIFKNMEAAGFTAQIEAALFTGTESSQRYELVSIAKECAANTMMDGTEACAVWIKAKTFAVGRLNWFTVHLRKGRVFGSAILTLKT